MLVKFISVQRYVSYCCVTRLLQSGVEIVLKKIDHEPSGCQIVKSQGISVFYNTLLLDKFKQWDSVDQIVLRHLFFTNSIFKLIIRDN